MALVMPRRSSWSLCWSPLVSSEGRYPCVLYNFILGNRQQATVVFGQAKKRLPYTLKKAFFCLFWTNAATFQIFQNKIRWHCKVSFSKVLSNISGIAALVPTTDILSMAIQHHVISWRGRLWSHINLHWRTFAWVQTRTLWHFHVQRHSITKMTHILVKNKLSQALIYLSTVEMSTALQHQR